MRITIQVTCDDAAEAQDAIMRLTRARTWEDDLDKRAIKTGVGSVSPARIDKIMGSSGEAAEQSGSNDGATGAPRPNISPGDPTITKIGADAKALILSELGTGTIQPHKKYAEHLKLLWKRGEIKWDGTEYYL